MIGFSLVYGRKAFAAYLGYAQTIVILLALCLGATSAKAASFSPLIIDLVSGKQLEFQVELALTTRQRQQGLMYRTGLAPDKGMLFIFPDIAQRAFWMRNVPISLDIIFLRKDGTILNIVANATPQTDTSRPSIAPAKAVLELAGGRAKELGIAAGDIVRHVLLGNLTAK
ncbi:MAG: DUF192 domain-containing protein [Kordiimonadaceae bacterium]|nr:DUF192 domain-containing protein [Kordiimonadaceae bacterium]